MEPVTTISFGKKALNFIAGPWGALIGKGLLILAVTGGLWWAISSYNQSIRDTQMDKDRIVQLEQVIKDNAELKIRMNDIEGINRDILIKLEKKNDKVIEKHSEVTHYIASPEAQKSNREASPVIKETIRILRDAK